MRYIAIAASLLIGISALLVGCSREAEEPVSEPEPEPEQEEIEREPEDPPEEDRGPFNPFTGLSAPEDSISRRPIAVVVDNHPAARPQVGLTGADLVFEMLAEGGVTRLMPVYLQEEPEVVGPVRSARPYILDIALSLDAVLAHCGGSPGAYRQIENLGMEVFNDLWGSGGFFRDPRPGVSYEHTLFTRITDLRPLMKERGFEHEEIPPRMWQFDPESPSDAEASQVADEIAIRFPGFGYTASFRYEEESDRYLRFTSGAEHLDRDSDEQLAAANVIVMRVATRVIAGDTEGRLEMDLRGEGEGLLVAAGWARDITWKKEDLYSPLEFFESSGDGLVMTPGVTWIELAPLNAEVTVREMNSNGQ
ncbi:MAG: DUF3048 domain-containing protein [Bacillota bacterium]